jgi:sigma-B regulation protein RsbU (phosphoserine phosphatase)
VTQDIDHVNVDIEWKIDPGDVVVLLTDGVTEAEDAHRHPFGYERVMQLVQRHARDPAEVLRDAVFAAVSEHSPELADDATVLVLRRMPT